MFALCLAKCTTVNHESERAEPMSRRVTHGSARSATTCNHDATARNACATDRNTGATQRNGPNQIGTGLPASIVCRSDRDSRSRLQHGSNTRRRGSSTSRYESETGRQSRRCDCNTPGRVWDRRRNDRDSSEWTVNGCRCDRNSRTQDPSLDLIPRAGRQAIVVPNTWHQ